MNGTGTDGRAGDGEAMFLDILMPGSDVWPAASVALEGALPEGLGEAGRTFLEAAGRQVAAAPEAERVEVVAALELREAAPFAHVLHALYAAYYRSPAVLRLTAALAADGGHAAGEIFDPSLVAGVAAEGRGRRRLSPARRRERTPDER